MQDLPSRKEVEAHARDVVARMTSWACVEFGLPNFDYFDLYLTFQSNYHRSRGGRGLRDGHQHAVLRLHLWQFISCQSLGHHEYDSYAHDMEIGGFISNDWRVNLDGLIAHELSHCIQHILPYWPSKFKNGKYGELGEWEGNHGSFFQNIYRKLRVEFVNPRLEFWQLTPPLKPFDTEVAESALCGKIIRLESGERAEILGLRPRARVYHYLVQLTENKNFLSVSPDHLLAWAPDTQAGMESDGFDFSDRDQV